VLYFAFEESPSQIMRNMRSIGLDLEPWVRRQQLHFQAIRPTLFGLELHLTTMHKAIDHFNPAIVIVDPLNSFTDGNNTNEVKAMLVRLVDFLKLKQITSLFTSLTSGGSTLEQTDVAISSLIDTWLLVRDIELGGERNRGLYILKSRGMAHSNQIREFLLTDHGVELRDVYIGPGGVLTGSARLAQEASERAALLLREQEVERHRVDLERKRRLLEAQITVMRSEFEEQAAETLKIIEQARLREVTLVQDREAMAEQRRRDATTNERGEHSDGA
jgi:circadian clock protein KaiC